ncbi:MAG: DNA repair protein RecO (recombination protein O) [Pelagibacterales bacterium]|nr:DNA repair protein RecO (recombination protein O) [Pelagibacterales bacterium]
MNWQDEGYLLGKRKFRDNANIIDVFTSKYGKMSGIVYGGNSRKIKNFLQTSNKIYIFYTAKNENRIGYFKTELVEAISPRYFNNKKKTSLLLSSVSILNILLPESQPNKKIYHSLENLITKLDSHDWLLFYVYWELSLIKELGFDTNLSLFESTDYDENKVVSLEIDGIMYKVPQFLISNKFPKKINLELIKQALIFTRLVMLNKFFLPNNVIFPKSRIVFESYF